MLQEKGDRAVNIIIHAILIAAIVVTLYPLWFVIIASVSLPDAIGRGEVILWPVGFTLEGYKTMLAESRIWIGYRNSIIYTVVGTMLRLFVQLPAAFAVSRKIRGRRWIMAFFVFTMYFSGGMIPSYLLINELGWLDNPIAVIVPGAMSVYNLIIARSFFTSNVPESLFDAAQIDGCGYLRFFLKIVLPLSGSIIAILVLFNMQGLWNMYLNAQMYLMNRDYHTLQQVVNSIVRSVTSSVTNEVIMNPDEMELFQNRAQLLKYCVVIVSAAPMMVIYPLVQKHFVKGVMVGAVKG